MALLLHSETFMSTADPLIYQIVRDLIQYNLAGPPVFHETTQWDFDPKAGKQRRIQYEKNNGRFGERAIAELGTYGNYEHGRTIEAKSIKDESSE